MIRYKVTLERDLPSNTTNSSSFLLVRALSTDHAKSLVETWLKRMLPNAYKDMKVRCIEDLKEDEFKNSQYFIN